MPKIIAELKENLIEVARDILIHEGYNKLSMRRVASECSIAVGTIYNYFPDKDSLMAVIMVQDWKRCLAEAEEKMTSASDISIGFVIIYEAIQEFVFLYQDVWQSDGRSGTKYAKGQYHPMLRGQIQSLIMQLLKDCKDEKVEMLVPLLAEAILAAAMQSDINAEAVRQLGLHLNL